MTDDERLSEETLDSVGELLERSRAREDVEAELAALPPGLREQVETVLEAQEYLLGMPTPLPPGTPGAGLQGSAVLAQRYRIHSELARGGMGVVYLAQDEQLGRRVVVKVMTLDQAWNPRLRQRFEREARALRKIHRHPNVVEVLDGGEDPNQGPYLVMEHVAGHPLLKEIHERRRLDPRRATEIARDVARGLAVVHRQGLIHRDVKPSNVILQPSGRAKLVDFGLAKDAFLTTITKAGQVLGTCYYMAPEQWREDEQEDLRCDIFALGATLYHMLVGQPPFTGEDLAEVMEECLYGEYEPAEALAGPLPGDLALALHQMLANDRRFRYARMDDVADDLDRILRGEPCRVPCLVEQARGVRHPLFPGRRWTLGREASCHIAIADPTVSREHAEVRREEGGFVLRDLASSYGTTVGDRKVTAPHRLCGGEVVGVGDVLLSFLDPHNQPERERGGVRRVSRDPAVRQLVEQQDARASASLVEALQPPAAEVEAEVAAARRLLGDAAAAAIARGAARRAARARADLAAVSGEVDPGVDGWLAWWDHARFARPAQVCATAPPAGQRLVSASGAALSLDGRERARIGRDARCDLVVEGEQVSRLHATLFRLHRRWYVRDEGSSQGTFVDDAQVSYAFLDPGARLRLAGVELRLEAPAPLALEPLGGEAWAATPAAFEALLELRHPAVAQALRAFAQEDPRWIAAEAAALFADEARRAAFAERLRQVYAQRAELARALLPTLTPEGTPQLLPRGWLAATCA